MSATAAKPFRFPSLAEIAALDERQRRALIYDDKVIEGAHHMYQLSPYEAAKRWGLAHGLRGELGGWIWREGAGRPVCQGWMNLWKLHHAAIRQWHATEALRLAEQRGRPR